MGVQSVSLYTMAIIVLARLTVAMAQRTIFTGPCQVSICFSPLEGLIYGRTIRADPRDEHNNCASNQCYRKIMDELYDAQQLCNRSAAQSEKLLIPLDIP